MTKVIALGNQKGGVAKTTSSLNLCYSLANTFGKKVLLIDMDSQGSAGLNLGIRIAEDDINTIDNLLEPLVKGEVNRIGWEAVSQCIYTPTFEDRERDPENKMKWKVVNKPFGFDVLPSNLYLSVVEMEMGIVGGMSGKGINMFYLKNIINTIEKNADYDFIVIDTPPSLGALSINSMAAAVDGIIVVSNLDVMSVRGISSFIESSETVQRANPAHRGILGIEFSMFSDKRVVDKEIDKQVKEFLPIPTFDSRIPETSAVKTANSSMLLVSQLNKKAKAAFDSLAQEVMYAIDHPDEPIGSAKTMMKENG